MMKITGLSHPFNWENLHNWWLTNNFFPHCMCSLFDFIRRRHDYNLGFLCRLISWKVEMVM